MDTPRTAPSRSENAPPGPETPPTPFVRRLRRPKAVALVLVIVFVVLLSGLIVSFFARVATDLGSSRSYAEGVAVRQLADSAVSVVMGQIRAATSLPNAAWASQPGMIRTYRSATGQPGPDAAVFFKLYSSNNLTLSGADIANFDPTVTDQSLSSSAVEVPLGIGGWRQQPAFFTDLNEPVEVADPEAGAGISKTIKRYPIFDPSVAAIYNPGSRPAKPAWKVEGCEIALSASDRTGNDAPMPVRWIYILADGTLTTPVPLTRPANGTLGLIATWSTVGPDGTSKTGVPTKTNPIVGRMGFWTDDDSCKINLNTAGGFVLPSGVDEDVNLNYTKPTKTLPEKNPGYYAGSFWDTPRVQTYFDRGINNTNVENYRGGLSNSQPGRNEFQRYPGHPSTTSLGLVFKNLLPGVSTGFSSAKLYAMTPRLMPGGSKNGNARLETKFDLPLPIKSRYTASKPGTAGYHLFGSVDELAFTTLNGERKSVEDAINEWVASQPTPTDGLPPEVPLQEGSLTPDMVDKVRFFLTAKGRSPELNLFGRPRVAIWPVPSAKREALLQSYNIRNASDDFIRFCATVGRNSDPTTQAVTRQGEFIFDREDPYSSTVDFNLPRNQQVFGYLRELTSSSGGQIPGFGGNFETKYANGAGGRDQILTEIFDYIRTINQKDGSRERTIDEKTVARSLVNNQLKAASRYAPHAIVIPTRTTFAGRKVSGFGRYPTISEATLVFYNGGYTCQPKKGSDLEKADLPDGGSARTGGNNALVTIYDLTKSPGDPRDPASAQANLDRTSDWAKANVERWTGQLIRAFVIFETFNPMQGYAPVDNFTNISLVDTTKVGTDGKLQRYNFADTNKGFFVHELKINGQFAIQTAGSGGAKPIGIGAGTSGGTIKNSFTRTSGETWGGRNFGGMEGFFHTMQDDISSIPSAANYYAFQSRCEDLVRDGVRVGLEDKTFDFFGGDMDLFIRYEDKAGHNEQIQKITLNFPNAKGWPLPTPSYRLDTGGFDNRNPAFDSNGADSWHAWGTYLKKHNLPSGWGMGYNLPSRIAWSREHSYNPWTKFDKNGKQVGDGYRYANRFLQIVQPGDTIRSLVVGGGDPAAADPRIGALQQEGGTMQPHPDYFSTTKRRAETLRYASGGFYFDPSTPTYAEPPESSTQPTTGSFIPLAGTKYKPGYGPDLVRTDSKGQPFVAKRSDGQLADFDTGIGSFPDGAFAGKADEGNVAEYWQDIWGVWHYVEPYFTTWVYDPPLDTYFSPNRQVPGPVMFGSLPAPHKDWSKSGWKTLLFCPNPAGAGHPGAQSPPDHLLLDLFNMPVVEPYAISEPFSTAGKVNLNYPMVPFSFIKRTTALRAALHPLRVTAIPQFFVDGSKQFRYKGQDNVENFRYLVDRDETLKAFDDYFDQYKKNRSGGFFKSASQICERYLYPKGTTVDGSSVKFTKGEGQIKAFWEKNQLTGDNVREKPYADLYPRITTKSNTYTIHYRVQTLRQRKYTGDAKGEDAYYRTFDESRDRVLAEFRGNTTIERYLDPEDPRFQPSYVPAKDRIDVEKKSLEEAYRFRIIYNKRFSPW